MVEIESRPESKKIARESEIGATVEEAIGLGPRRESPPNRHPFPESVGTYWTLVGYYNSIRELGGANRLVEDDVVQNINFLADAVYQNQFDVRDPGTPSPVMKFPS